MQFKFLNSGKLLILISAGCRLILAGWTVMAAFELPVVWSSLLEVGLALTAGIGDLIEDRNTAWLTRRIAGILLLCLFCVFLTSNFGSILKSKRGEEKQALFWIYDRDFRILSSSKVMLGDGTCPAVTSCALG